MSAAFDTLRLARILRDKAHFSAEQADGMADAMAEALQSSIATKADIQAIEAKLRETDLRLAIRVEEARGYLLKWVLVGAAALQAIISFSAALALARVLTR